MPHRLFIAIRPPEPVRDALIDTMEALESARWQSDEQLHLTLRFVGEVEGPVAEELATALGHIDHQRFHLALAGVGHFEKKGRVNAIWARISPSEPLLGLRRKVERACLSVGLERETRAFVPHVTIARMSGSSGSIGGWLADHGTLHAPAWEADHFTLYESHLGSAGADYQPVVRYKLRG